MLLKCVCVTGLQRFGIQDPSPPKVLFTRVLEEMYREWRIRGGKPSKSRDDEPNRKVKTVLSNTNMSNQQNNKKSNDCYNCGSKDHRRNKCPLLQRETKKDGSTKGRFGGY